MATKPKRLKLYKAYAFRGDKDPAIDEIHTILDQHGASYYSAAKESGVSASCIMNWIEGKTMRPQHCTLAAVAGAFGYEYRLTKRKGSANIIPLRRAATA